MRLSDKVMRELIEGYTREAGVRTLERTIAKVIRKAAVTMLDTGAAEVTVTSAVLKDYLGAVRFTREMPEKEPRVGVVNGLAYTPWAAKPWSGCAVMPSRHLAAHRPAGRRDEGIRRGRVLLVRAHSAALGLKDDFYKDKDIHIHVPRARCLRMALPPA